MHFHFFISTASLSLGLIYTYQFTFKFTYSFLMCIFSTDESTGSFLCLWFVNVFMCIPIYFQYWNAHFCRLHDIFGIFMHVVYHLHKNIFKDLSMALFKNYQELVYLHKFFIIHSHKHFLAWQKKLWEKKCSLFHFSSLLFSNIHCWF
jgi:hypothetical protein